MLLAGHHPKFIAVAYCSARICLEDLKMAVQAQDVCLFD